MTTPQKEPFNKELLKTIILEGAKVLTRVALELLLAYFGGVFAFGTAAGFLDILNAGYAAAGIVGGVGTAIAAKTLVKGIANMPAKIKAAQQQNTLNKRLTALEQAQAQKLPQAKTMPKTQIKPMQKVAKKNFNIAFWKRKKEYDRAA